MAWACAKTVSQTSELMMLGQELSTQSSPDRPLSHTQPNMHMSTAMLLGYSLAKRISAARVGYSPEQGPIRVPVLAASVPTMA